MSQSINSTKAENIIFGISCLVLGLGIVARVGLSAASPAQQQAHTVSLESLMEADEVRTTHGCIYSCCSNLDLEAPRYYTCPRANK